MRLKELIEGVTLFLHVAPFLFAFLPPVQAISHFGGLLHPGARRRFEDGKTTNGRAGQKNLICIQGIYRR